MPRFEYARVVHFFAEHPDGTEEHRADNVTVQRPDEEARQLAPGTTPLQALNDLGRGGWEVVGVTASRPMDFMSVREWWLKRVAQ